MSGKLVIGLDVGTSGARAVAMAADFAILARCAVPMAEGGADPRQPQTWWNAAAAALDGVLAQVERGRVAALAVDATSGTVLPVDAQGVPLAAPLMYDDKVADAALLARLAPHVPEESAAHGPTSGLAKALHFSAIPGVARIVHQADWLAGQLCGRFDLSDANNALKTGYDPVAGRWPDWIADTGLDVGLLPQVAAPGEPFATVSDAAAHRFGLPRQAVVAAGTTDGCASFLATGAGEPGDAVTALGSTLTLKVLSTQPVFAPGYGIYSHRIAGLWLAGGASNSGGRVLARHFDADALARLSRTIDPSTSTGLDYYPLPEPGERFPIMDPDLQPRLEPRPQDDATFLKALLEGIAGIEALGYRRLAELGAPKLRSVRSVGGGGANPAWTAIRARMLGVPLLAPASDEAAAGTARLALAGARKAGVA